MIFFPTLLTFRFNYPATACIGKLDLIVTNYLQMLFVATAYETLLNSFHTTCYLKVIKANFVFLI